MTVAAAKAIENQLQIQKALREAQIASAYQKTVIAFIPEALIAIDNQGRISLINENARSLLRLEGRQVVGEHISRVFGPENRRFRSRREYRDPRTDVEVRIFAAASGHDYTLSANPILSPQGEVMGKILTLNEIHRVKTLVNKMIGAKANFHFTDICGENPEFLRTVEQPAWSPRAPPTYCSWGKAARERTFSPKPSTMQAAAGTDLISPSTAPPSPGISSQANCSVIPRDPSRDRGGAETRENSNSQTQVPFFSTRSPKPLSNFRPCFCASSRTNPSSVSVGKGSGRWMCVSSPQRTRISWQR
jgi:hypothetical protein